MPTLVRLPASALLGAFALALAAGCSSGEGPTTPGPAVRILTVSPDAHAIVVGQTYTFDATVTDGAGRPVPGAQVTWRSSAPDVASVDGAGVVTGRAVGQTMIVALLDGTPRDSSGLAVTAPAGTPATPPPVQEPPTPGPTPPAPVPPAPVPPAEPGLPLPSPPSPPPATDARCGGVRQTLSFDGTVAFRYSRTWTINRVTYTFNDIADMTFSVPRTSAGRDGATWSGVVRSGDVRLYNKIVDRRGGGADTSSVVGVGQPERTMYGEEASYVTVNVDLRTCTYTLSAAAAVMADVDDVRGPMKVGAFSTPRLPLSDRYYEAALPVHSTPWVLTSSGDKGYFTGGPLVEAMFLAGHGNDNEGEGTASTSFFLTATR
jgi:hypothetical protein